MGWASGSGILADIIYTTLNVVTDYDDRKELYEEFIKIFESADADTLDECLGIDEAFDDVYKSLLEDENEEEEIDYE